MVTAQEIQEREKELDVIENQARQYAGTIIPQRRYGAGVTPKEQAQYIKRREEGVKVLGEVRKQRIELEEVKGQYQKNLVIEQQIADVQLKQKLYSRAVDLVQEGRGWVINFLPKSEKNTLLKGYVRDLEKQQSLSKKASKKQIASYREQGIEPVYSNGKLTGFEDVKLQQSIPLSSLSSLDTASLFRYERAGIVTLEKQEVVLKRQLTPDIILKNDPLKLNEITARIKEQRQNTGQSKIPYQSFFGKVEKGIQKPFEKLALLSEKQYVNAKYEYGFGIIRPLKEGEILEPRRQLEPRAIRFAGSLASYPVYSLKRTEEILLNKQKREEFGAMGFKEKSLDVLNIGLSYASLYSIGKGAKDFLKEPIKIKEELKLPQQFIAKTNIKNVRVNEKLINIAEFEIIGVSAPQRAITIQRWEALLKGLKPKDIRLDKYSLDQLKSMLSTAEIKQVRPLSVSRSVTEPFIIKGGRIQNALGRQGEPAVFTLRQTINTLTGKTRTGRKTLSILSGETYNSKSLKTISPKRTELPKTTQTALEELEKVNAPKEIKVKEIFDKELEIQEGGVRLEDLFKISRKTNIKQIPSEYVYSPLTNVYKNIYPKIAKGGVKVVPKGKRISRAEITAIQKSLLEIKNEGTGKLKEIEILGEKIGAVDVTFPKLSKPKKAITIKGLVFRYEYEIPYSEPVNINIPSGNVKTSLKFSAEDQKLLQKAIGSIAIKQSKIAPVKSNIPTIKLEPQQKPTSLFYGAGLYERTEEQGSIISNRDIQAPSFIPNYKVNLKSFETPKFIPANLNMNKSFSTEISKEVTKELSKNLPKLTEKGITKEVTKQIEKQTTKQIIKQVPKLITKPSLINTPFIPRIPIPKTIKTPLIPKIPSSKGGMPKDYVPGYKPFVLKGGKKFYLDMILPKGKALMEAEEEAKRTLRATFGVEKAGIKIKGEDINFKPSKNLFRSYRIKQGKKIPLKDEYIQKLGKRLSSAGEIKEIQISRSMKL